MAAQAARAFAASHFDLTIVGGGIVGLATARQVLLKHPKLRVCVLDKEKELASHQSKRNSGVVHCGIYYKKGSLKSKFCIKGANLVRDYCQARGLPFKPCGKLIVATDPQDLEALHALAANAKANRIEGVELIGKARVERIQPGCTDALEAIWSPNTAIVDWRQVALSYADDFQRMGGTVIKDFTVWRFMPADKGTILIDNAKNDNERLTTRSLVNCAGVYSDYLARQTQNNAQPRVVPFKGNYFQLSDRIAKNIRTCIYPVPNPKLPFLGVHITPRIDGSVLVGPTALLVLDYERYSPDDPIRLTAAFQILFLSGLFKLIRRDGNYKAGFKEIMRRIFPQLVALDAQQFIPDIRRKDLIDINFNGIRAQVVDAKGRMVDDFLFETGLSPDFQRVLHVRNCPSPAATSSLAIAERVVSILEERFI